MPPEMRAPGQRSLISGSASMNALRVVVVLLDPGRDREHVRVEDDVLRREAGLVDEQLVGALADLDLAARPCRPGPARRRPSRRRRRRSSRTRRACARNSSSPSLSEIELTIALALHALQAGLEHRPARAVDHDRQPRDLGLGGDHVQEGRHRLARVEQVGVHVHVEQVRAAAHLLERDVDRRAGSRPPRSGGGSAPSR